MPRRSNSAADLSAVLNANPVLDMDNVYFSDQGWAYRHYKDEAKSAFWDEILVAGQALLDNGDPDLTAAVFGTASPTFETGDSVQAPLLTIAYANIEDIDDAVVSTTSVLGVSYDAAVTDATFAWSTDEAGATFDDNTLETPTATHAAVPGTYTMTCVISSATASDSPLTVTASYEVVAA